MARSCCAGSWQNSLRHGACQCCLIWLLQARGLYRELGAAIEQHGDAATVREAFPQFAVVDEWYFMECEEIFPKVYNYVRGHFDEFVGLLDFQDA